MAAGTFVIQELRKTGQLSLIETDDGEPSRFEWTADRTARTAAGGARAAPVKPWSIGGSLVTARTDYAGALVPSEQVMTRVQKPHSFRGSWSDKWNFRGYAEGEMLRFEEMCARGNKVRIQFQRQTFEGIIVDWDFPYQGDWLVNYQFQFSVHARVDDPALTAKAMAVGLGAAYALSRTPPTVPDPQSSMDVVDLSFQSMLDAHQLVPRNSLVGDLADRLEQTMGAMAAARDAVAATLEQSQITGAVRSGARLVDDWRRLGTQMRSISAQGRNLLGSLADLRSDTALAIQDVGTSLDFEDWHRSLRFNAVATIGNANQAAKDIETRSKPPTVRTYKAQAGETIYQIALRFYGRAAAWSYIAERNNLHRYTFDGTEKPLEIPERGEG